MTFRAGAARIIITPPVGVELAGYGFGPSVGILDDLEAQALVLEGDGTSAVIVAADLLTFGQELVEDVRNRVETSLGIPGRNIIFSASHSHSSPTSMPLRQWGQVDATYGAALASHLVGAITLATRSARDAHVGLGVGRVANISENRRGTGVIDPEVPVLRIDDSGGEPMAVLFNFGCHPVSLHSYRNLISPDYPGYARSVVRALLGQDVAAIFTLGTAGDINPAGYVAGATNPERSRQIGAILGCEVAKVALDPQYDADAPLRVTRTTIDLPVAALPSEEELRAMRDTFAAEAEQMRAAGEPWARVSEREIKRDWATDALQAWESGALLRSVPCELCALRIGTAALLAAPLEIFTDTGLAIKAASPAWVTAIISNADGGVGYLATIDAYRRRDYTNPQGLAPKVYGLYALSEDAEPLFRQAALELIGQLF